MARKICILFVFFRAKKKGENKNKKKNRCQMHRSPTRIHHTPPAADALRPRLCLTPPYLPFWVNTFTGSTYGAAGTSFTKFFGIGRSPGAGCDWQQHELRATEAMRTDTRVTAFMV